MQGIMISQDKAQQDIMPCQREDALLDVHNVEEVVYFRLSFVACTVSVAASCALSSDTALQQIERKKPKLIPTGCPVESVVIFIVTDDKYHSVSTGLRPVSLPRVRRLRLKRLVISVRGER